MTQKTQDVLFILRILIILSIFLVCHILISSSYKISSLALRMVVLLPKQKPLKKSINDEPYNKY